MTDFKKNLCLLTAALFLLLPFAARAQDDTSLEGLFPAEETVSSAPEYELSPEEDTHPMLRLTPDRSEIVRLDREGRSIVVGNPAHLNVLMDNTETLILVPKAPGATYFTILDKEGRIVMQRHVIVASPKDRYVRVRKTCPGGGNACQQVTVYYCPDMCHEIQSQAAAPTSTPLSIAPPFTPQPAGQTGATVAPAETETATPAAEPAQEDTPSVTPDEESKPNTINNGTGYGQ